MAWIQQIYVTHCTPQEAAFGEGYTARNGSLPAKQSQEVYYQAIHPLLAQTKFVPPRDTPHRLRARGSADRMPARLVYLPSYQGYRLLGHLFYRSTDSTGTRIGSYFAHFLFAPTGDPAPWPPAACLQLWKSPGWVRENSAALDKGLEPVGELRELLPGNPHVSGAALEKFLTAERLEPTEADPDVLLLCNGPRGAGRGRRVSITTGRIAHRAPPGESSLFAQSPQRRRQHLESLLEGFLNLNRAADERLLLIADPGVAALLFFGILELVPPSVHGLEVSFSTFETELQTPPTLLTATTFHCPSHTRLRPEESRGAAFIHNVFADEEPLHPSLKFPGFVVDLLITGRDFPPTRGWQDTTRLLRMWNDHLQPHKAEELEECVEADRFVQDILPPRSQPVALEQFTPVCRRYAQEFIRRELFGQRFPDEQVRQLSRSPNIAWILEQFFGEPRERQESMSSLPPGMEQLIPCLPAEFLAARRRLPPELPVRVMLQHVKQQNELPRALKEEIESPERFADQPTRMPLAPLLPDLVANLPAQVLASLFWRAEGPVRKCLLQAIVDQSGNRRECQEAFWNILRGHELADQDHGLFLSEELAEPASAIVRRQSKVAASAELAAEWAHWPNYRLLVALLVDRTGKNDGQDDALALTAALPEEHVVQVLTMSSLPWAFRGAVLRRYVDKHGEFPDALRPDLYSYEGAPELLHREGVQRLLSFCVIQLSCSRLVELNKGDRTGINFTATLLDACERSADARQETPTGLASALERIASQWPPGKFENRVRESATLRPRLVRYFPEKTVRGYAKSLLGSLTDPQSPSPWDDRVATLELMRDRFGDLYETIAPWSELRAKTQGLLDAAVRKRDVQNLPIEPFLDQVKKAFPDRGAVGAMRNWLHGTFANRTQPDILNRLFEAFAIQYARDELQHVSLEKNIEPKNPRLSKMTPDLYCAAPKHLLNDMTVELRADWKAPRGKSKTVSLDTSGRRTPTAVFLEDLGVQEQDLVNPEHWIELTYEFRFPSSGKILTTNPQRIDMAQLPPKTHCTITLKDQEGNRCDSELFLRGLLHAEPIPRGVPE